MSDSQSHDPQEFTAEDERLLDLLVDGELDEQRRRKLLLSFDEKPSKWRRCALAFLEAQSWGSSFKSLLQPQAAPRGVQAESPHSAAVAAAASTSEAAEPATLSLVAANRADSQGQRGTGKSWHLRPMSGLAMAASMLVAFTLGLALRNAYSPSGDGSGSGGSAMRGFKTPAFELDSPLSNLPDATGDNVRLVVDGDGNARTVDVPLLDDPSLVDSFPFRHESAIPADILHQLEQMGHRIEHRRRLAPVELQDGRRLYLPVEDVKIVPVRRQMY